jgi:hypothetical protein
VSWEADKVTSDRYMPTVKAICGVYFIGEALPEEDQERNTDLIVLNIAGMRIAVRIRTPKYWEDAKHPEYRQQFTIREARPSGTLTEFKKIITGYGHAFFYGHGHPTPPQLRGFGILDLNRFRLWVSEYQTRERKLPGVLKTNGDGTQFRVFDWRQIPKQSIIASYPSEVAQGIALVTEEHRKAIQLSLEYSHEHAPRD